MQVAEILSDLTSLRACGRDEAFALVKVRNPHTAEELTKQNVNTTKEELSRAKELVDLHYGVKMKHVGSPPDFQPVIDEELQQAREDVRRVMKELESV